MMPRYESGGNADEPSLIAVAFDAAGGFGIGPKIAPAIGPAAIAPSRQDVAPVVRHPDAVFKG